MLKPQEDDTIQTSLNSAPEPNKKDRTFRFSIPNTTGRFAQRFCVAVCTLSAVYVRGYRSRHDKNIVEQDIKLWLTTHLGRDFIASALGRLLQGDWNICPSLFYR